MILKLELFKESENEEIQGFRGWTKVELKLNYDDVIINLIVI